jgi:RNA polymerase sigma-70 factor (ECF subfamily)
VADVGAVELSGSLLPVTASVDDFAEWVRPHLTAMAHLASRLAEPAERDDIVQDSLTRAWRRWETYRPERGSPRVWLLAIVADRARRLHRASFRRRLPPGGPTSTVTEPDVDLEVAIRKLPARQRLAVELHYFVDLSVTDAAAVMGCSEGTVKSTLFDARGSLRKLLEER